MTITSFICQPTKVRLPLIARADPAAPYLRSPTSTHHNTLPRPSIDDRPGNRRSSEAIVDADLLPRRQGDNDVRVQQVNCQVSLVSLSQAYVRLLQGVIKAEMYSYTAGHEALGVRGWKSYLLQSSYDLHHTLVIKAAHQHGYTSSQHIRVKIDLKNHTSI